MVNDRQFLITEKKLDGYNSICLKNKNLYYQRKLPVHTNGDSSAIILGDAWQADPSQSSPYEIIKEWSANTSDNDIFRREESWAGRYILIVGNRLYQDFASQFCTFFDESGNFSSSLNLLTELDGQKYIDPKIRHGLGMNYIPGPYTPYPNIKKVMCSEIINIETLEIYQRPIIYSGIKSPDENTVCEFSAFFINSLKEMRKTVEGEFRVALTGGYDSRALLSMLKCTGIDFSCFTFETEHVKGGGDFTIPPVLCEKLNIKHELIPMGRFNRKKYNEYVKHTCGMANDGDLRHYSHGQYDMLSKGKKINVLYSGIWEVYVEFYITHSKGFKEEPASFESILKSFPDAKLNEAKYKSLQWFMEHKDINKFSSDRNRFYIEERDGCWMSYIAQGFDMMEEVQMYQPCNCRLFANYLFAFPIDERIHKEHQKKIIEYNCPEIASVPFSNSIPKMKQKSKNKLKAKMLKAYYYTKWYGIKSLVKK